MEFNFNVIPDFTNFTLQLIATIILFLVIRHFLYAPVSNLIEKRKELVVENLAKAEKEKEQAMQLKEEYQASLVGAHRDAKNIVDSSRELGEQLKKQIVEEAHGEVTTLKERASRDIQREREESQREMKEQIGEIAMLVASKVIEKNMDTEVQQGLIDQFIDEVGGSQWQI